MENSQTTVAQPERASASDAIARAAALRPTLRAEQAESEKRGTYSEAVHREFLDAGFYKILVPRMFGGLECDLTTYYKVMIEVSRGDPGVGWCLTLGSSHALMAASHFGESAQRTFFRDGFFCAPHTNAGRGILTRVDGGWSIDGRWAYSSGVPYSTWFFGLAFISDEDGAEPGKTRHVAIPREQIEVLDDWSGDRVLGMGASGSNGVVAKGVLLEPEFVVDTIWHERFDPTAPTPGVTLHGNPMYLGRGHAVYHTSIAAVQVGTAMAALDEYEEQLLVRKSPIPPGDSRIASPHMRSLYGQARVLVDAAYSLLTTVTDRYGEYAAEWMEGGQPFDLARSVGLFALAQQAGALAAEAVELMFRSAGTSAAAADSPLNRYFRDTAMYRGHQSSQRETYWDRFATVQLGLGDSLLSPDGPRRMPDARV